MDQQQYHLETQNFVGNNKEEQQGGNDWAPAPKNRNFPRKNFHIRDFKKSLCVFHNLKKT
jgi:hypothetical protein